MKSIFSIIAFYSFIGLSIKLAIHLYLNYKTIEGYYFINRGGIGIDFNLFLPIKMQNYREYRRLAMIGNSLYYSFIFVEVFYRVYRWLF
jgi:hypothetical protein